MLDTLSLAHQILLLSAADGDFASLPRDVKPCLEKMHDELYHGRYLTLADFLDGGPRYCGMRKPVCARILIDCGHVCICRNPYWNLTYGVRKHGWKYRLMTRAEVWLSIPIRVSANLLS